MGHSWLPEPPVENHSPADISSPTLFLPDFDNDDQDVIQIRSENDGYRLLADNDIQEDWQSENEDENIAQNDEPESNNEVEESNVANNVDDSSSVENSKEADNPPRDITVDFDQVRAAMARVTLPNSAIPAWAAEVPDSELASFLQQRISVLQQNNSTSNESKH